VRVVLDEMWSPAIAVELRSRGFDVVAISEAAHASRYAGIPDDVVFARAQENGRAVVTDNVADYERARRHWENRGGTHHGVVYALDPPNRHTGHAVIGRMVRALDRFLGSAQAQTEPFNRIHFLRPVESDQGSDPGGV
jgi:Domain of unknown function (DUF5615)